MELLETYLDGDELQFLFWKEQLKTGYLFTSKIDELKYKQGILRNLLNDNLDADTIVQQFTSKGIMLERIKRAESIYKVFSDDPMFESNIEPDEAPTQVRLNFNDFKTFKD